MIPVGLVVLLGAGRGTSGLTPPLSSSVAPSGIVPPLSVDETVPGFDSGEAVPLEGDPAVAQPDVVPVIPAVPIDPIDPAAATPPPSKVEPVPIVDVVPIIPDEPEYPVPAKPQLSPGVVAKPPGLISVAPSGSPVGLDPVAALAPGVPSGDVIPIPGATVVPIPDGPVVVCANAVPPPAIKIAAARARSRCIENLQSVVRSEALGCLSVRQVQTALRR